MNWHKQPLAALDTETTGTDPYTARVVQLAVVTVDPDGLAVDKYVTLVDPECAIPPEATAVHGLTDDCVRHAPNMQEVLIKLRMALDTLGRTPLVIFNAVFDWPLLLAEFKRHNIPPPLTPDIIDPLVIDRQMDKFRTGRRTLTDMARHYGITVTNAHDALADCLAATAIARALFTRYPALAIEPAALMHAQRRWHLQWAADMNRFWVHTRRRNRAAMYWPAMQNMPQPPTDAKLPDERGTAS